MPTVDIRPLTALRFIAAMLVFFSHYSGIPYTRTTQPLQSIFLEGHVGVTIFFVLSGFLITVRYFPAMAGGSFSSYSYFLKRAARILPLYWFMLALAFISSSLMGFPEYAPQPLTNWTLTQGYFSGLATTVLITGWSLTAEIAFYLIAPLILRACVPLADDLRRVAGRLFSWTLALLFIGFGLIWFSHTAGLNQPYGFMSDFRFMSYFTLFGRGFHFCVGIFVALLYLRYRDTLWLGQFAARNATALFILSLLGIVGLQILMNDMGGVFVAWYLNLVVALLAGGVILSLTCPYAISSRLLSHPLPVYLGFISYALFLFQATPLARLIYQPFREAPILFYMLINTLSIFFYEGVERPARRFILWAGSRATPPIIH